MANSISSHVSLSSGSGSHTNSNPTAYDSFTDESGESQCSAASTAVDKFKLPTVRTSARSGEPVSTLPERVFGNDRYPRKGRVNTYSNLQFLIDIVDILGGSTEFSTILASQFGHLFRLPVSRCSLSGKLVHNILCRQVLSDNNHDSWFTFGGTPLRFSISEFAFVTRLNCSPLPVSAFTTSTQYPDPQGTLHWNTLIGNKKVVKISELITRLRTETTMPDWKRLQLALVVIVDGVILCNTHPVTASLQVVEMVKDVPFFLAYPWGRHSFYLTLRMMKVGDRVKDRATLTTKLKQTSLVLHGFPLAIQLWLFKAIPGLLRYLPHSDNNASFLDQSLDKLPRLMTYHTANIFLLENERPVIAFSRVCGGVPRYNVDVMHDPCIAFLENCLDSNKLFKPEDWKGGDLSLPPLCLLAPNGSWPSSPKNSTSPTDENMLEENSLHGFVRSCEKCTKLEAQYDDLLQAHTSLKNYMPLFVAAEVDKLRASFKSEIMKTIHETFATKRPDQLKETSRPALSNRPPQYRSTKQTVSGTSTFQRVPQQALNCNDVNTMTKVLDIPKKSKFLRNTLTVIPSHSRKAGTTNKVCTPPSQQTASVSGSRKRKFHANPLQRTYATRTRTSIREELTPITVPPLSQKTRARTPNNRDQSHAPSTHSGMIGYDPFPVPSALSIKKFVDMLQSDTDREYILDGNRVLNEVFLRLMTPQKWVLTSDMDLMVRSLWKRRCDYFKSQRITVTDCYFTQLLSQNFKRFVTSDPTTFEWPGMLQSYVHGKVNERNDICPWGQSVDTIYAPMNWGDIHWVGLVISLKDWDIKILDPLPSLSAKYKVRSYMSAVVKMLPYLIRAFCKKTTVWSARDGEFTYQTLPHNSANERTGDCGPLTIKFLELHSHHQSLEGITPELVDQLRMEIALNVYSDFVGTLP